MSKTDPQSMPSRPANVDSNFKSNTCEAHLKLPVVVLALPLQEVNFLEKLALMELQLPHLRKSDKSKDASAKYAELLPSLGYDACSESICSRAAAPGQCPVASAVATLAPDRN